MPPSTFTCIHCCYCSSRRRDRTSQHYRGYYSCLPSFWRLTYLYILPPAFPLGKMSTSPPGSHRRTAGQSQVAWRGLVEGKPLPLVAFPPGSLRHLSLCLPGAAVNAADAGRRTPRATRQPLQCHLHQTRATRAGCLISTSAACIARAPPPRVLIQRGRARFRWTLPIPYNSGFVVPGSAYILAGASGAASQGR